MRLSPAEGTERPAIEVEGQKRAIYCHYGSSVASVIVTLEELI